MVQQNLHSLDILLMDGMEQGVLGLHLELQQKLDHLQVLVVDSHEQRGPGQPIRDQYCDADQSQLTCPAGPRSRC